MNNPESPIAIIGMSGKFPGASSLIQYWKNLVNGVDCINTFAINDLFSDGEITPELLNNPDFIPAKGYLKDATKFDPDFFGISKKKAKIIDPQVRMLLECVWTAFEDAGHKIFNHKRSVGVYASTGLKDNYYQTYFNANNAVAFESQHDEYELLINSSVGFTATQIAYYFDFLGPAIDIQTACSSSLVALCKACDDLKAQNCNLAVVAAASITFPLKNGYIYKHGMIRSKDGHCKPFSSEASGMVAGNGGGVVLLKTLKQAQQDGDKIYALIKGYAINNDGHNKLSFAAPSIEGQSTVLAKAAKNCGCDPSSIDFFEAHGTATPLGDKIEVEALKAYLKTGKPRTTKRFIGSVKSNIGHLDAAAGIAGFIKAVLTLDNKIIPPSLHATKPNPALQLSEANLHIPNEAQIWEQPEGMRRRAAVSSFGVGGTNAHMILEEHISSCNNSTKTEQKSFWQILPLSAKTESACTEIGDDIATFLHNNHAASLNNIAYTLQTGREPLQVRNAIICNSRKMAETVLFLQDRNHSISNKTILQPLRIAYIISGSSFSKVSKSLQEMHSSLPYFRKTFDTTAQLIDKDFRQAVIDRLTSEDNDTTNTDNNIFIAEHLFAFISAYTIIKSCFNIGIKANMLIGEDLIGELVAATLADIFEIDAAINLLISFLKDSISNKMRALCLLSSTTEIAKICANYEAILTAVNTDERHTITIPDDKLPALIMHLEKQQIIYDLKELRTLHLPAEHQKRFSKQLSNTTLRRPNIPISTTRNNRLRLHLNDINYWKHSANDSCNFKRAITKLIEDNYNLFITVSTNSYLASDIQQINRKLKYNISVIPLITTRKPLGGAGEFLHMIATTWSLGVEINWQRLFGYSHVKKISLPGYPFAGKSYCINTRMIPSRIPGTSFMNNWLYTPKWSEDTPLCATFFDDDCAFIVSTGEQSSKATKILSYLENKLSLMANIRSLTLEEAKLPITEPSLDATTEKWAAALKSVTPITTIYILYYTSNTATNINTSSQQDFYNLLALGKAIARVKHKQIKIVVTSSQLAKVTADDIIAAEKGTILGPTLCIPLEYSRCHAKYVDVCPNDDTPIVCANLLKELCHDYTNRLIAYRQNKRYVRTYSRINHIHTTNDQRKISFKHNGIYLITGGLGGIGLTIAEYLVTRYNAKLILISKNNLPAKTSWPKLIRASNTGYGLKNKLEKLIVLLEKSANITHHTVDIADTNKVTNIIHEYEKQNGKINGIIHAAATPPSGLMASKKVDEINECFAAKIAGLKTINSIFEDRKLDFLLLFSALNAESGAIGAADYVGANSTLNLFSFTTNHDFPIITISWPAWNETGMLLNYLADRTKNGAIDGIKSNEGIMLIEEALAIGVNRIIVSTDSNIGKNRNDFDGFIIAKNSTNKALHESQDNTPKSITEIVTAIWRECLEVESLETNDNFFELGGDSLIAIEISYKIKKQSALEIDPHTILEYPTLKKFLATL